MRPRPRVLSWRSLPKNRIEEIISTEAADAVFALALRHEDGTLTPIGMRRTSTVSENTSYGRTTFVHRGHAIAWAERLSASHKLDVVAVMVGLAGARVIRRGE